MSDFEDALVLMMSSDVHKNWYIKDVQRLIVPPIALGQCGFLREDSTAVGFFTYGWFTKEAEEGFTEGTRKIKAGDWNDGNILWVIDFIAPFGHTRQMFTEFGKLDFLHKAKFRRSHSPKVVRAKGRIV